MRVLIISDIHGNLTALESVLADAGRYDQVWCLGDLVGYGPHPNECVERVRALPNLICLVGNHDKAAIGEVDIRLFNLDARAAIAWTQRTLTPANQQYLRGLPSRVEVDSYTLAHASPRQPIWEYVLDRYTAALNFEHFNTPYCLVGHTHIPVTFVESNGDILEMHPNYKEILAFSSDRVIINPGSVGQPRDRNPAAAYAILDTETRQWEHRRVPYDVEMTQRRMIEAGLPPKLSARLQRGA